MNNVPEQQQQKGYSFPVNPEEDKAILDTAMQFSTHKRMKFKKGQYFVETDEVPLGTEYLAHCVGWCIEWARFEDGKLTDSRVYRVNLRERVPPRDELGDLDRALWKPGNFSEFQDPWSLRHHLPMQSLQTGELHVFYTQSFWGGRTVSDLCANYARKHAKQPDCGQPIIKLQKGVVPSKRVGEVIRPVFEIVGWDSVREGIREYKVESLKEEMDDEIPF